MNDHFQSYEPTAACAQVRDAAAELALGVLPAQERAAAILHLDDCPDCRAHLRQLTLVADQLLGLVPGVEPPAGFEQRVLGRFGLATAEAAPFEVAPVVSLPSRRELRRDRRPVGGRTRVLLAAAAAVITLVAGVGGFLTGQRSAPDSGVYEAFLTTTDHQTVGEVYAVSGEHGWVSMKIDTGGASETVICKVVREDGSTVPLGKFSLKDGKGWWGAPVEPGAAPVRAQLVREDGTVLASGSFPVR
jgi:hypothetical protein